MKNKYYEVEFAKGNKSNYISDYSICIVGKREPTTEEATEFCRKDLDNMGYDFISNVTQISKEEAHMFFDMENESSFPVFM